MKAWIISIAVILFAAAGAFLYYLYEVAREPVREREAAAVELAGEHVDIATVRDTDYYHGRRSYQVIDAVNQDGEDIYIWVQETEIDEEPLIEVRLQSEGLSRQEAVDLAYSELAISNLKAVRLGMAGSTPVYEITYRDEDGRQSFYYVRFEDGGYIRHYQF